MLRQKDEFIKRQTEELATSQQNEEKLGDSLSKLIPLNETLTR